ncbi:DUF4365 domain-containing protein [Streptomyces sp. AM2-3-1]|uniref:DUF4365 domain-containing protein n=1 Tax=Streptomyces sp. AM2-3-1 TaxID=3075824 RepID=UPI0028C440F9|nr:DUF4365 domain-containing protein [Streptomyces sp. AM2-3-1]WNO64659.1 DUF4365 domain-containing protein [Streptomyces sp. AM2-3-1]
MPNRPREHEIGAKAESAVQSLWVSGGHAVDTIREDYGEDLLVQVCHQGRVKPSRIWVQVKGTKRDCSDTSRALPTQYIKATTMLRWSRSADMVVVVLWDVTSHKGWYAVPQGQYDHMHLAEAESGRIPLKFDRTQEFNLASVDELSWRAHINHTDWYMQDALSWLESEEARKLDDDSLTYSQNIAASLLHEIAIDIGIFTRQGKVTKGMIDALTESINRYSSGNIEETAKRASIWSVLKITHDNCGGNGLPATLLAELVNAVMEFIFSDFL